MKETKIIFPDDPIWQQALSKTVHEFYHLPQYAVLDASLHSAKPCAYYYSEDETFLLMPLLLHDLPQGGINQYRCDAKSPYGYPGWITNSTDPNIFQSVLHSLCATFREYGILTAFIRLNPFNNLIEVPSCQEVQFTRHGPTVVIDLAKNMDELDAMLSTNHRRNIKKLNQEKYDTLINDWSRYDEFIEIYTQTMERLSAGHYYFFSRDYFYSLREIMADDLTLCCITDTQNKVVAGGIFSSNGIVAQYHLGGTHPEYMGKAPSKKMFYDLRAYFKQQQVRFFHLGGGLGAKEDSLFQFKYGFSQDVKSFCSLSLNPDNATYQQYNQKLIKENNLQMSEDEQYFPLYRKMILP
jgi:hypothetical protein